MDCMENNLRMRLVCYCDNARKFTDPLVPCDLYGLPILMGDQKSRWSLRRSVFIGVPGGAKEGGLSLEPGEREETWERGNVGTWERGN